MTNEDKSIDALALQVFMEQLGWGTVEEGVNLHCKSYSIRKKLSDGSQFVFLIPSANTWKASNLVQEFSENPYAYEFGMMLARYGALGDKSSNNEKDSVVDIGLRIIDLLGGREKLMIKTLNEILQQSAKPGDSFNGSFSTANFWVLDPQICPKRMRRTLICKSIVWLAFWVPM